MALSEQELLEAAQAVGLVAFDQVEEARKLSRRNRLPLLQAVSRLTRQPVAALWQAAAQQRGIAFLQPSELNPAPEDLERLPPGLVARRQCLPLRRADGTLLLATANPDDTATLDHVGAALRERLRPALAFPEALAGAIERTLGEGHAQTLAAEDTIALVDDILSDAFMEQASDIHLQPAEGHMRVRFRVDGVLRDWRRDLRPAERDPVVNRFKVLADLDIAESRAPQDGGFLYKFPDFDEAQVEVRLSTLPVRGGERVVMRLLGSNPEVLNLSDLGLPPAILADLRQTIRAPFGVVLVTGPTGSGKSTTLYSALREIDRDRLNVLTVEDPIEQMVAGASQVQITSKVSFAGALRSILRQDPDVILVGEIRDGETADIALKAAQTGHLVFSTLHTNTALGALTRLADLGVGRWQVAASLVGVLAQRLVPKLCDRCARSRPATAAENLALGRAVDDPGPLRDPVGCPFCMGRGYRGRVGVFEAVWIDEDLRDVIAAGAPESEMQRKARRATPLALDLIDKVVRGQTSFTAAQTHGLGRGV